jgi:hypothetical protein
MAKEWKQVRAVVILAEELERLACRPVEVVGKFVQPRLSSGHFGGAPLHGLSIAAVLISETGRSCNKAIPMSLIVWYLGFMIAGDFVAYFIGRFVEYEWGSNASLFVFLTLYFLSLWTAWLLSVWATKPKVKAA